MKKLFSVLAVLLVATALFAQVGLTVKAGGAFGFANYKSVATASDKAGEEHKWEEVLADKALILKENGFGFDVGVQYDITDKLLAYVDFNMLFPGDAKTNVPAPGLLTAIESSEDEELKSKYFTDEGEIKVYSIKGLVADLKDLFKDSEYIKDVAISTKTSFFSVSAGAAYKLDFDAVKLAVGGGVTLNKATSKYNATVEYAVPDVDDVKFEGSVSFTTVGLNVLVDAKYMVAEKVGVGVTLMPQIGLYNKGVLTFKDGDDEVSSVTSTGFKVSFAMPIAVGVSYTF